MAEKPKKPAGPRKPRAKKPPATAPLSLIAERGMLTAVNYTDGMRAVPGGAWPQAGSPDMLVPTYPFDSAGGCVDLGYYPYYVSQLDVVDRDRSTKQCNQQDAALHSWVIVKVRP